MTLYRIFHGRERPFDQTPEERAKESSRLKTCALVAGLGASLIAIFSGILMLPDKIGVASAKALQAQLDDRYVKKEDYVTAHKDLADADQKRVGDMEDRIMARLKENKDDILFQLRYTNERVDKIFMHTSYSYGILKGETRPTFEPRRPQ